MKIRFLLGLVLLGMLVASTGCGFHMTAAPKTEVCGSVPVVIITDVDKLTKVLKDLPDANLVDMTKGGPDGTPTPASPEDFKTEISILKQD